MGFKSAFTGHERDGWDKALAYMRAKTGLVIALSVNRTENLAKGFVSERHVKFDPLVRFLQHQLYCWAETQDRDLADKYTDFAVSDKFSPKFSRVNQEFSKKAWLRG
jgi:hypothetical protein